MSWQRKSFEGLLYKFPRNIVIYKSFFYDFITFNISFKIMSLINKFLHFEQTENKIRIKRREEAAMLTKNRFHTINPIKKIRPLVRFEKSS